MDKTPKVDWDVQQSESLYGIQDWGKGFFSINSSGHVVVVNDKLKNQKELSLYELVQDLRERGLRSPLLIRFPHIIQSRIERINSCFQKAIKEYEYSGKYFGVYPIKVNQQRHVLEEIVRFGKPFNLGLECGSKPELLIALAFMKNPGSYIVCNGFKDQEYIETALLSQKLGQNTFIVIDRRSELDLVVEAARKLDIRPRIGFRAKIYSQGSGKWMESSGFKSKFGLTPSEIVEAVDFLKQAHLLDSLELLHFHVGSQIPSIHEIKASVKEAGRIFSELCSMGAPLKFLDVGGGLGVDYDGSGHGDSSTNYSDQEYANDVISIIQSICEEKQVPCPHIISESGRAIVAHSSLLVFDVLGSHEMKVNTGALKSEPEDTPLVKELLYIYEHLDENNINEFYNDLQEKGIETRQLFSLGGLSLKQRAKAEDLYWAIAQKMAILAKGLEEAEDIYWNLQDELSGTYFCNFSVFQSLPDSWAVGQLFPVMPIHRLDECPGKRVKLVDLTCDSDGKIEKFIDTETDEWQNYLEVHSLKKGETYYIGVFLTGAYQETLGDLHNLFGDTDAVHITMTESGYTVDYVVEGDTVTEVLSYVEYSRAELIESIRLLAEEGIRSGRLSNKEARLLMRHYEQGLSGYTYHEGPEGEL
ncbi:MAG: biosynthetic arginine decarboxylase [Bdellovibrio sp.]|nr:MAG: biosynthetic arginine decarboxylase [Bdellovibrio sp.]